MRSRTFRSRGLTAEHGLLAIAVPTSNNAKIGACATTYAAQTSCPSACVFKDGGGCYAENGRLASAVTIPLNGAAALAGAAAIDVALEEAAAIDALYGSTIEGRPLRLHTVGDCSTDETARIVSAAAERYMERGGGPVWTYTHAWREVARESWGIVSVLASCETAEDCSAAAARGYAPSIVVEEFASDRLYDLLAEESCRTASVSRGTSRRNTGSTQSALRLTGQRPGTEGAPVTRALILPCPAQTRANVSCASCRLCMNDSALLERGYAIGFAVHGTASVVKLALKALRDPDDPRRRPHVSRLRARLSAALRLLAYGPGVGANRSSGSLIGLGDDGETAQGGAHRRYEPRMSGDERRRHISMSALPLGMASLGVQQQQFPFEPNWIDYSHSLVVVDVRRDKGEDPQTCDDCGCEVDIDPAPHSPKCSAVVTGETKRRSGRQAVDGLKPKEPRSYRPRRAKGALLAEVLGLLAGGPLPLAKLAGRCGYTSENLGGWLTPHVKAGRIIKVERGVYALPEGSERGPPRAATEGADVDTRFVVMDPPDTPGEDPPRSENDRGRRRAWERDDILDAIRRWDTDYGHPPTSTEWMRRVDGYPTTTTVATRFGSWANAVEQAGFPRPARGGVPLRPLKAPAKRVRVRGTGLTYESADAAYLAADEIEADGQRVAEHARFDGKEAKAEQAIDQSRELAEKIRDAAHAFEARTSGSSTSTEVEKPEEASPALGIPLFHRALARAAIAAMRAAADTLEQELTDG